MMALLRRRPGRVLGILVLLVLFLPYSLPSQQSTLGAAESPRLQPGDVLRVQIWREQDLSGEFTVDENGVVTLPLLGEQQVSDVPLATLRQDLVELYRLQLRNPSIDIVPLRKVFVLGSVRVPGTYTVSPTTSVLALLAEAEGITSGGDIRRIRIFRGGDLLHDRVPPEMGLSDLGIRSGDQVFIGQQGWFTRNRSFVVSVLLALPSVVYTITRIAS
jgi:protein involved in polysaccharide export with SLBB domain